MKRRRLRSAAARASVEILATDASAGLPVVIGVPFTRGTVRDVSTLGLFCPSGASVPVAARSLVNWPDGSARWVVFTLLAREKGTHHVSIAKPKGKPTAGVDNPVRVERDGETVSIGNGLVRVVLNIHGGGGPVRQITALGHDHLADARSLRFVVNDADTTREGGRTIEILEESPLRVRVRVSGAHVRADGSRLLNYRLDVDLWAGWPTLRLDYQFMHLENGRANAEIGIDRIGMDCDLSLGGDRPRQRHFLQSQHGMLYVPREVFNEAPVSIVADESCGPAHVEDPAMLLDEVDYPAHLRPPLVTTAEWLGVGDGRRSVYVRMQDFAAMRPKRLRSDGANVSLDIWPTSAGLLKLPQGRTRRQVLTLAFGDQGFMTTADVERLLGAPLHEGRAVISPAYLRATGEFEADRHMKPAANVRFEQYMNRLVNFETPQDMFDLGDTIDTGYCRTYAPVPNNSVLKRNAPAMPRVFLARHQHPMVMWANPHLYEPIWTNNEYDGIWVICTQMMRTGRSEYWNMARWFVRHNVEVDFVHYHDDRQQHRATPQHGVGHNMNGSIPSHFWTQGLLMYYCMTGDPDVLEVATALGDKIIDDLTAPELRPAFFYFSREIGWPILALAHLVDITGEDRFRRMLDEILEYCMSYQRPPGFDRMLVGNLWCWSCMFEGVDLYQRRTGRKDLKRWLEEFLESECREMTQYYREGKATNIVAPMVMAIGYERTGDRKYLRAGLACLEEFMDTKWWETPPQEIRPVAMTYRGLVRFLHHASAAGMLDHLEHASIRAMKASEPKLRRDRRRPVARKADGNGRLSRRRA